MEIKSIETIIDQWKSEGIKLNPPSNLEAIKVAEEILDFQFPLDFKEFYLKHDGLDISTNLIGIWPLTRIIYVFQKEYIKECKNFITFADFNINSNAIGYIKCLNGIYKHYYTFNEWNPELIAICFFNF